MDKRIGKAFLRRPDDSPAKPCAKTGRSVPAVAKASPGLRGIQSICMRILFLGMGCCMQASLEAISSDALSVSLRVTDNEGNPFKEAGIGVPFLIQLEVISDGRKESPRPQLTLPSAFSSTALGTTSSVRTVNSDTVSKRTYQYGAVASEEGTFTIGPSLLTLPNGDQVRSNTVTVRVGLEEKRTVPSDDNQMFVEFSADTTTPYVGQAVKVSLRFYYLTNGVHLEQLQEPTFKDCKATPLQGPVNGQVKVRGEQYGYLEWTTTLFPTRSGKIVIPSVVAQVSLPAQRSRGHMVDMFAMVNQMFGNHRQHQIQSNALTLMVQSLPAHEPAVTAIGKFSSLNAKLGTEKAQTGEGISFILELVGEGNFSMIGHPVLDLPEGLKYYDSHAKEHPLTHSMYKKDFEYVLQALQPGTYQIPPQRFEYFDGKTKTYKTLTSKPVKMTITGAEKKGSTFDSEEQEKTHVHEKGVSVGELERSLKGGGGGRGKSLPWTWFVGLAMLLIFPLIGWFIRRVWERYRQRNASYYGSKRAFVQAHQDLKTA